MAALSRQKISVEIPHPQALVLYVESQAEEAIRYSRCLRAAGERIRLQRIDRAPDEREKAAYRNYAAGQEFEKLILFTRTGVEEVNL